MQLEGNKESSSDNNVQSEGLSLFTSLRAYVDDVGQEQATGKDKLFSMCIRSSFVKCYEFNLYAWDEDYSESSFHWLSTLRGICEDIIVLNYVQDICEIDRNQLLFYLQIHELNDSLKVQNAFFQKARPQQAVIHSKLTSAELEKLESDIRNIWRTNGWPDMKKKVMPPTYQIAQKSGRDILQTLYEYMYRLTSKSVHFSVRGLLRHGWGELPNCTFSTKHFSRYYTMFGRIYGAFMFCIYFELFGTYFPREDEEIKILVDKIRRSILKFSRWPEMVTPEEMNMEPPEIKLLQQVVSFIQADARKRLLDE